MSDTPLTGKGRGGSEVEDPESLLAEDPASGGGLNDHGGPFCNRAVTRPDFMSTNRTEPPPDAEVPFAHQADGAGVSAGA